MPTPKFSAPWSKSNRSHSSVGSSSDHSNSLPAGKPATRPPSTLYEAEQRAPAVNHDAATQRYPQPDDQQLQQQQQQQQQQSPQGPQVQQGPQGPYRQVFPTPARTQSHRHSSNLSLERPPGNAPVHAADQQSPPSNNNAERAQDQRYSYQQAPPTNSPVPYVQEPKKSLRSRLGLGHSHKDEDPARSNSSKNSGGIGRRVSVRKSEPSPTDKFQSQPNDPQRLQGQQWQRQEGSSPHLPTSEEEDESNLDPFLQQDDQPSPHPLVPPKDGYHQQFAPNQHQEQYRPPLARVNTETSYHTQGGADHYSPEQHSGHQQPPQYQPYQQPQQPADAGQHPHQYQAFNPTTSPHPGNNLQQQDLAQQIFYHQQQQQQLGQGQQGNVQYQQQISTPSSLQSTPQDLPQLQRGQSLSAPQPPPHQQEIHQPQAVHQLPQIVQQQDPQQEDSQHVQQLRPPSQQQFAPPSPLAPQYQAYDGQQGQQPQGSDNAANSLPQQGSTMPPPGPPSNRNTLRKGEGNQQNVPGAPSRESSLIQPPQQGQGPPQPPTPGLQSFGANVVPAGSQGQPYRGASKPGQPGQETDVGRATPPPRAPPNDMTDEEVQQLVKEHEVLREKYQKVKRYFFEQQTQVHQLQNTLAHQRLSLSRTSWDDTEYSTRFNRLDGLIAQLSFAIRKDWKAIPPWLQPVVNKTAVETGKQEMTAVGRAFISSWLVDEIFERVFHPDLEPTLSTQLKIIQLNIRKFAPTSQSGEEEDALVTKVINWRLATLEGLAETLRTPQCATNRQRLTDQLNEKLIATVQMYLQDPAPPDLAGGIPMIVELAINIAQHVPLESREVHIEYFHPGHSLAPDFMKMETGIPALTNPIHDPNADADKASLKSTASDLRDSATSSVTEQETQAAQVQAQGQQGQGNINNKDLGDNRGKRGMFGSLMGNPKKGPASPAQLGKQQPTASGAGSSQVSLSQQPPGSSNGPKEEQIPPRVRLAVGFAVQIRGKSILMKAPVYST